MRRHIANDINALANKLPISSEASYDDIIAHLEEAGVEQRRLLCKVLTEHRELRKVAEEDCER